MCNNYGYIKQILLVSDAFFLFSTFWLSFYLRTGKNNIFTSETFVLISLLLFIFYIFGSYELILNEESIKFIGRHLLAIFISICFSTIYIYILYIDRAGLFGRGVLIGAFFLFIILSSCYRFFLWRWLIIQSKKINYCFITNRKYISLLSRELSSKFLGDIVFYYCDKNIENEIDYVDKNALSVHYIDNIMKSYLKYDFIIMSTYDKLPENISKKLIDVKLSGKTIIDIISFYELFLKKVPLFFLKDTFFFSSEGFVLFSNSISLRIKYLSDFVLSFLLFLIAIPFMLLIVILIKLDSQGTVFFKQIRTGLNGKKFLIYKFRSMIEDAEKNGAQWAEKKDKRITRIGKILRLTRLDELPQLINVLRGEMSFIGPRPERPEFNILLEKEIPYYQLRHSVKPGITGLAQILYPYGAGVADAIEKFQYDIFYIKNYSFLLDILILFKTIRVVIFGKGR